MNKSKLHMAEEHFKDYGIEDNKQIEFVLVHEREHIEPDLDIIFKRFKTDTNRDRFRLIIDYDSEYPRVVLKKIPN